MKQVSLVIPFYNESKKFGLFKEHLLSYLPSNRFYGEMIWVNDGSTDDTGALLDKFSKEITSIPVSVIHVSPNKGKGNAIKEGIKTAKLPWVLCNDADFSYLPNQIDEWVDSGLLDLNAEKIPHFGSRELGMTKGWVKFKWHRRIIGRIYALLIRWVTGINVTDTQCGFKLYPTDIAQQIFQKVKEERFAFDVEVHYLLKQIHKSPRMLPVHCIDRGDSKVDLIKDSWQMWQALFRIKKQK